MRLTSEMTISVFAYSKEHGLLSNGSETKAVHFNISENRVSGNDFGSVIIYNGNDRREAEEKKYSVKFIKMEYETGKDNSGKAFERVNFKGEYNSMQWDHIGNVCGFTPSVYIQTWDRKEVFVTFHFVKRGDVEIETVIAKLDTKSQEKLSEFFDKLKSEAKQ